MFRNSSFASVSERTIRTITHVTDERVAELSTYFDFSLSIRLLFLMAMKSAGISVYYDHDFFVFTSRFFGSTFAILTTFQIGILARTTFTLISLLSATCIFAR